MTAAKEGEGWTGSCGAEDGVARDLDSDDVENKGDERDVASWVEVTSRVFRVRGQESVFVIPAWDMHPGAEAVRKSESQPFVQTVVRGKSSQQAILTVKERSDGRNDTEALKEEIDGLKYRLQLDKVQYRKFYHGKGARADGPAVRKVEEYAAIALKCLYLRTTLVKVQSRTLQQQRSKSR